MNIIGESVIYRMEVKKKKRGNCYLFGLSRTADAAVKPEIISRWQLVAHNCEVFQNAAWLDGNHVATISF